MKHALDAKDSLSRCDLLDNFNGCERAAAIRSALVRESLTGSQAKATCVGGISVIAANTR